MNLGIPEAQKVIKELAIKMGKEPRWVAEGIIKIVNTNMALATKLISTERGYDARDYTLVAFGGAGPLHAVYIAQELGIGTILVPRYPGLLSAFGLLLSDFKRDYVISHFSKLDQTEITTLKRIFKDLENTAHDEFRSLHFDKKFNQIIARHFLDMRYKGQAYELTIPFNFEELKVEGLDLLKKRFNQMHKKKYGHSDENQTIEIVNYRLDLVVPQKKPSFKMTAGETSPNVEKRKLYLLGKETEYSYYSREALPIGYRIPGPAIVEEHTSTTLILGGWTGVIDSMGNVVIRKRS
jgi:N-methylhydantoinase A